MKKEPEFNTSILVVDDEQGILEAYRNALAVKSKADSEISKMVARRRRRSAVQQTQTVARQKLAYNIITASSGEEAVEITHRELQQERQISVGFFDMTMPGGIDGMETIRQIRQLDNQILCAVVTAYTDRSPSQLGTLFARQDDWLYFNKPFSTGELEQTAYHLVTAWNQRRREESLISNLEMMSNGLLYILQTAQDINRVPPLVFENLLQGILSHFLRLAGAQDGFVFLPNDGKPVHFSQGIFNNMNNENAAMELQKRWGMVREVMQTKAHAVVNGNTAVAPLRIGEEVLGALFVQARDDIEQDPKIFDIYASQAVNMIQQSRLYDEVNVRNLELSEKNQEMIDLLGKLTQSETLKQQYEKLSYIDSLTSMPNRRYLDTVCTQEVERSRRRGEYLVCLLVDIDHFKQVNDQHGHIAGDYVLREIGILFKNLKRPKDVIGRYGGEEFLVLFRDAQPKDVRMLCERLRISIEKHDFQFDGEAVCITVSIGCVAVVLRQEDTLKSLVEQADSALYRAKENGRNQTVILNESESN